MQFSDNFYICHNTRPPNKKCVAEATHEKYTTPTLLSRKILPIAQAYEKEYVLLPKG